MNNDDAATESQVSLAHVHRAKGFEFKAVRIVGVRPWSPAAPLQSSMAGGFSRSVPYSSSNEIYLYVALTRAREQVLRHSYQPAKQFFLAQERFVIRC